MAGRGPSNIARQFKRFVINGFRFRTKDVDRKRKNQNSGVFLTTTTTSFEFVNDNSPVTSDIIYYGVLQDVIELDYYEGRSVVLFKCDWIDSRGIKQDDLQFTLVNLKRILHTEDKYVLASQAMQVFYVEDLSEKDWHVAIRIKPRDFFDMQEEGSVDIGETCPETVAHNAECLEVTDGDVDIFEVRPNVVGITVKIPLLVTQPTFEDEEKASELAFSESSESDD